MPFLRRLHDSWIAQEARLRAAFLTAVLLAGGAVFIGIGNRHYPIQYWLFWHYAACVGLCVFWSASVLSCGHVLLKKLLRGVRPLREQLVLAFALGVFAFFILTFVAGLLGLLGKVFFVVGPTLLLASGAKPLLKYLRRLRRHIAYRRSKAVRGPKWWSYGVMAFGLIGAGMVYVNVLHPHNVSYDARWYHLQMAEEYAVSGHISRFAEGWFIGAYPQLASYLYSWAFQLPFSTMFDRVELAAHLEFTLFLWTLFTVPALVRAINPRVRMPGAWSAMFLFPGLFLYDNSLCGAADHVAAFWAAPVFIALVRAYRDLSLRYCLLLAVFMSGALVTKYTAVYLAVAPALAVFVRASWLLVTGLVQKSKTVWQSALLGSLGTLAAGLVLTSPHWLKNWVWYGDPLYPMLNKYLTLHPWSETGAYRLARFQSLTSDRTPGWEGVKESLAALWTHSFAINIPQLSPYHGNLPVFGSLFTLTTLCLLFLKRSGRIWALFCATYLGLFVWHRLPAEDRYLQTLVPWMAAGAIAVLGRVWQFGLIPRIAAASLVGLQIVWGGNVYFMGSHPFLGTAPIKAVVDLINTGLDKNQRKTRYAPFDLEDIGKVVTTKGTVLMHEEQLRLGLGVPSVYDSATFQAGLVYEHLESPRAFYDKLRSLDVTHIAWTSQSRAFSTVASDLAFFNFVTRRMGERSVVQGWNLAPMPATPPTDAPIGQIVAFYGCQEHYEPGLYHLRDLSVLAITDQRPKNEYPRPFEAAPTGVKDAQLERASFLAIDFACNSRLEARWAAEFKQLGGRGALRFYVKESSP